MSTPADRQTRIAVLGSGTWGIALARVLSLNGHSVIVWSKFPEEAGRLDRTREAPNLPGVCIPEGIRFTADPAEAAEGADYLLMVVPSIFVRDTAGLFAGVVKKDPVWIYNFQHPEIVGELAQEYADAGAQIILKDLGK